MSPSMRSSPMARRQRSPRIAPVPRKPPGAAAIGATPGLLALQPSILGAVKVTTRQAPVSTKLGQMMCAMPSMTMTRSTSLKIPTTYPMILKRRS